MKTLKNISIYLFAFVCLCSGIIQANANEIDVFHKGNIAYQKGDYSSAISAYKDILKSGSVSTEVYFNLGNAYFKSDSLAKAILNYERAKKLNPDDEDILANLKLASIRVVDKIDPIPQIFYKRWLIALAGGLSSDTWSIVFLSLIWLAFASALLYIFGHSILLKKISFFLIFGFLALSAFTFIIAKESHSENYVDQQGIVMVSTAYIKSAPDEKGNDLFILHEGAKVEASEIVNGYRKIKTANGSVGWIAYSQIEII